MVKKYQITAFERLEEKPAKPVTKFGGQPDWLEEPQWPVSKHWKDRLMSFVGQIVLDKGMLDNDKDIIAYVFLSHPENRKERIFYPYMGGWDSGEHAVIIQPGGEITCETKNVKEGPCMFGKFGNHYEYIPTLVEGHDPDFINDEEFEEMEDWEQSEYINQVDGNKIGGIPCLCTYDEWPDDVSEDWKFLLQLVSDDLPFVLQLEGRLHAFISSDFKQGGLLIENIDNYY